MKKNLKYYLRNKLNAQELKLVPSSFDVVGDILIFADFPRELERKKRLIGETILSHYNNLKTIAMKTKQFSGRYRLPKYKIISGKRKKEAIHKENNVVLRINIEKAYFSPRMSNERKRIAELIMPDEIVLVMFSGVGIYPMVISKNTKARKIIGIEINPAAHKYAVENLKLNKTGNVKLILGDVKKEMPKLKTKFDRIIMPLPKGAENFLDLAFMVSKKHTIIHLYQFLNENEFGDIKQKIEWICSKHGIKCEGINVVKCGQFSPHKYRACVDLKVGL